MNNLNYRHLIFYDLETSGLDFDKHEIIQISAIDAATGDSFNELLDFDINSADQFALEKNSFDQKLWDEKAVPQETGLKRFAKFVRDHAHLEFESKGRSYKLAAMAGYNVLGFDKFFIDRSFRRQQIFFPGDYRMFDIYPLVLWKYPGLETYSLESMCNLLKIRHNELHDSLEDVKATIELAKIVLREPLEFKRIKWAR